jgi:hypothetical protein
VSDQGFGLWKPLKIRYLERCKNSQGREKDLGKYMVLIYRICEEAGHYLVCGERFTKYLML